MGVSLMEKEQEKCELCKYIMAINAEAAEERRLLKDIYGMDDKTQKKLERLSMKEAKIKDAMFLDTFIGSSAFMIAYRTKFDYARFTFVDQTDFNNDGNNIEMVSTYIQYCPCCGREIKQYNRR